MNAPEPPCLCLPASHSVCSCSATRSPLESVERWAICSAPHAALSAATEPAQPPIGFVGLPTQAASTQVP